MACADQEPIGNRQGFSISYDLAHLPARARLSLAPTPSTGPSCLTLVSHPINFEEFLTIGSQEKPRPGSPAAPEACRTRVWDAVAQPGRGGGEVKFHPLSDTCAHFRSKLSSTAGFHCQHSMKINSSHALRRGLNKKIRNNRA